jgi:AcrR family transcriptional regulator
MPAGRPRSFDVDDALTKAMRVFWEKGYEGASMSDLTEAMGINRPSLYAAFGDKEALFGQVVQRYQQRRDTCSMDQPSARAVVEELMRSSAVATTEPGSPPGCLLVMAALPPGADCAPARQLVLEQRMAVQDALRERLERAAAEGELPEDTDPADLARYVMTVCHGLAVHAASGATTDQLNRAVTLAMRAWPT